MNVIIRDVEDTDLDVIFEQQRDPESNRMAAFTAAEPNDRDAFNAHWAKILSDTTVIKKTILADGAVAGHIVSYEQFSVRNVGYWLGTTFWRHGIASRALALLLDEFRQRPLYARAAADNLGSIRVLEKCGFTVIERAVEYSNARNALIEEVVLRLT